MEIYKNLSIESLPNEDWRDIVGYVGLYQVSNLGNIRSFHPTGKQGGLRTFRKDKDGYEVLFLHKGGLKRLKKVHRIVAEAFIPNPNNKPCIDHINTIKTDNRVENLRWVTIKENSENPLSRHHLSIVRTGTKASEATRKKFSDQRRGEGNGMFGKHHTEATKMKMSKPIIQLSIDGSFVAEFFGAAHAYSVTGIHRQTIVGCLKGRYHTAGGYKWKYKEDYD